MSEGFSLPQPGEYHELLKPFAGRFRAEVKMWMQPGEPHVTTGTMVNSFRLNDLYLHQDYQGDSMEGPFPAFAGEGFWGYNSTSRQYEGFWIDNVSPAMQMETGTVDETGKVWTMHSETLNPQTGEPMVRRSVITLIDEDHNKIEMYFSVGGEEIKNMEIDYHRIAAS